MSPARFRKIAIAALVAEFAIVVTGVAVRLTGSGLGCEDWPNCNDDKFIDVSTTHGAIEQINRLFTGVVMVAVVAAVLGAFFRRPQRRDLKRWAIIVAVATPMQGLVGAVVVFTDLNPFATQQHFLLSMVLVGFSAILVRRAGEADDGTGDAPARVPTVGRSTSKHVTAITVLTGLALVSGTFVTGAGPHAGDETAKRFDVAISTVARIHGFVVMLTIAVALALLWRLRSRLSERKTLDNPLTTWMILAIAQAGVGYTQYFNGVPALMVGIHVALATGLWLATVQLQLSTSTPETISRRGPDEAVPSASYAPAE